jgi:acetyltransferase
MATDTLVERHGHAGRSLRRDDGEAQRGAARRSGPATTPSTSSVTPGRPLRRRHRDRPRRQERQCRPRRPHAAGDDPSDADRPRKSPRSPSRPASRSSPRGWAAGLVDEGVQILNQPASRPTSHPSGPSTRSCTSSPTPATSRSSTKRPARCPSASRSTARSIRDEFDTVPARRNDTLSESFSKALLDAYGDAHHAAHPRPHRGRGRRRREEASATPSWPRSSRRRSPTRPTSDGVELNIRDEDVRRGLQAHHEQATARERRPDATIEGVTVQPMVAPTTASNSSSAPRRTRPSAPSSWSAAAASPPSSTRTAPSACRPSTSGSRAACSSRSSGPSAQGLPRQAGHAHRQAHRDHHALLVPRGRLPRDRRARHQPPARDARRGRRPRRPRDHQPRNRRAALREALLAPRDPPVPGAVHRATAEIPNGRKLTLRPIKPEDEPRWHDMLAACSPESIRRRFSSMFSGTTHNMAARYCFIDYDREIAIVAEVEEGEDRKIIGVGRLARRSRPRAGRVRRSRGRSLAGAGRRSRMSHRRTASRRSRRSPTPPIRAWSRSSRSWASSSSAAVKMTSSSSRRS